MSSNSQRLERGWLGLFVAKIDRFDACKERIKSGIICSEAGQQFFFLVQAVSINDQVSQRIFAEQIQRFADCLHLIQRQGLFVEGNKVVFRFGQSLQSAFNRIG